MNQREKVAMWLWNDLMQYPGPLEKASNLNRDEYTELADELLSLLQEGSEPVAWREKFFHADCTLHTVLGIIEEDGAHLGPVIQSEVDKYLAKACATVTGEVAWRYEELDDCGNWNLRAGLNYDHDDPDTRYGRPLDYLHVEPNERWNDCVGKAPPQREPREEDLRLDYMEEMQQTSAIKRIGFGEWKTLRGPGNDQRERDSEAMEKLGRLKVASENQGLTPHQRWEVMCRILGEQAQKGGSDDG